MRFFLPWILAVLSLPTVLMADEIPSWLQDAMKKANAGDAIMQLAVARSYADGTGVDKDHKKAFEWYRKAADQGNAKAEYAIAQYYINGTGVKANKKEAQIWLLRAKRNGHPNAEKALGILNAPFVSYADIGEIAWKEESNEQGAKRLTAMIAAEPDVRVYVVTGKKTSRVAHGVMTDHRKWIYDSKKRVLASMLRTDFSAINNEGYLWYVWAGVEPKNIADILPSVDISGKFKYASDSGKHASRSFPLNGVYDDPHITHWP